MRGLSFVLHWKIMVEKIDVGWIDPGFSSGHFTHSLAQEVGRMEYFGCLGNLHRVSTSIPLRSRNMVVEAFLEGDSEWLWLVDDDMVFSHGHVMELWNCAFEHGVKMVSGLAFIFKLSGRPVPSFYVWGDGEYTPKGELIGTHNWIPEKPMQVAATGLASSLIHREVFEAMKFDRFPTYRWFDLHHTNPQGQAFGEDLQFFVRAGKLGYSLMLNPEAHTWHVKEIGVGLEDWKRAWGKDEEE